MAKRLGNFQAMRASGFTKASHQRAPVFRWFIFILLAASWLVFGLKDSLDKPGAPVSDAIYRTLQALAMAGDFETVGTRQDISGEIVRFTGVALTAVGLLFGFSSAVGRVLARLLLLGAKGHVVIAGDSSAALALAQSCRTAGDSVVLIARNLETETAWFLHHIGIVLIPGNPAHAEVLRSARAPYAAHVVAFSDSDTENLRIEASMRTLLKSVRRRAPLATHVCIQAPLLLSEARGMRMLSQREQDEAAKGPRSKRPGATIDPRAFSLEEISARALLVNHGMEILDNASRAKRQSMHFVIFGFDPAAEAVAVRTLMSFWSVRFGEPRVTIITPDAEQTSSEFSARYPQARAHEVWKADIEFVSFDWTRTALDPDFLQQLSARRGDPSAVIVATGVDGQNIQLALALLRAANTHQIWAGPIFMHETMQSDFSRGFASSETAEHTDAYLQAFGSVDSIATRAYIIEGLLDRGAAIAHRLYEEALMTRDVEMRDLEALGRSWENVPETYRNANRAVVDSALVKLWDAGWRPALPKEKMGDVHPRIGDGEIATLAALEHQRWMAERLLSGWRPGPRDNRLMMHNNIMPWAALADADKEKDADQVRAAAKVARALFPRGFVRCA